MRSDESCRLRQIRLATLSTPAVGRAAPSDRVRYNQRNAVVVVLCSASKDANALKRRCEPKTTGLSHFSRQLASCMQSSLGSLQLCAPLMAFILVAFEATHPRSLVTTAAHCSMLHVLTDVRSRRAHRL